MTNGDKIRQMSDENMALWLAHFCIDYAKLVIKENESPPLKIILKKPNEEVFFGVAQSILKLMKEEVQDDG